MADHGYETRFHHEDDKLIVEYRQDAEPIVENARMELHSFSDWRPYAGKEMVKVASIPVVQATELHKRYNLLGDKPDWVGIRAWLNSPDNKYFRTAPGRV